MIYIFSIIIYISSVLLMRRYIFLLYSKGGKFSNMDPDNLDLMFTYIPPFNILGLSLWIFSYPKKNSKWFNFKALDLKKHFNVKNGD